MRRSLDEDGLTRLRLAVREDERRRWARELHDETLQALAALRLQLSCARRSEDPDTLNEALDDAVERLDREIANLRALITELRPAALDELGLQPALGTLFARTEQVHGLAVDHVVQLDPAQSARLLPDIETAIYRVVQESITNAARHSGGSRLTVTVIERQGEIDIRVGDDGDGFDLEAPTAGLGLIGMRERASLAGGRLELRSSPSGTFVAVSIPAIREAGESLPESSPALGA